MIAAPLLCLSALTLSAADAVPLPPAADLDFQVDYYLKEFDKDMEDLAASKDFAADSTVLGRDAKRADPRRAGARHVGGRGQIQGRSS